MFTRTREILVAHGATVEKFIGDAVMAVFGVPAAHEDDAERAIRAALALRADVSPNREDGRPGFTLRIGINTGEVVTGDGEGAEFLVTGEPVIVAARLEESAGHGEILVGPLTREITRGRVSYGPLRTLQTKGMGPIEVAAAESLLGPNATTGHTASPFVGRDAEMRLLDDVHRRVASTGRPHLVTIYGDAGMGKSRVALEFLRRLDPAEPIARAACLPYGHAITYWPLQELIRGEAAITPTDGRDTARSKIESRVAGMEGLDELESRAIARELAALALADADTPQSELTSDARRRELALGMTRYLEARLGTTPGTIVLEDLHWAEEPFLALLEELLEQLHAPLLLLCLARHDLLERRPSWGSGRTNAMAIALEPLDVPETEKLVRALLAGGSDRPVDEIVARTEGNPLFVEEYVHMLVDQGSRAVVPPTLHGVIAARIDATTPGVKRLLHEASVIGRDFWLDALPTTPAAADVAEAERRGLISRRARVSARTRRDRQASARLGLRGGERARSRDRRRTQPRSERRARTASGVACFVGHDPRRHPGIGAAVRGGSRHRAPDWRSRDPLVCGLGILRAARSYGAIGRTGRAPRARARGGARGRGALRGRVPRRDLRERGRARRPRARPRGRRRSHRRGSRKRPPYGSVEGGVCARDQPARERRRACARRRGRGATPRQRDRWTRRPRGGRPRREPCASGERRPRRRASGSRGDLRAARSRKDDGPAGRDHAARDSPRRGRPRARRHGDRAYFSDDRGAHRPEAARRDSGRSAARPRVGRGHRREARGRADPDQRSGRSPRAERISRSSRARGAHCRRLGGDVSSKLTFGGAMFGSP